MKYFQEYIKPYLQQYSRWISLAVFFGLLTVMGSAMLTFTSGYLISSASLMPYNILMLYVPIVLVRTFGISQAVTRYVERLLGHNAVLKILSDMRFWLYKIVEPQALFVRERFQTGDLLGTLADDIEHLQDLYIRTIFPTIVALFLFVGSIISLSLFDVVFGLWIGLCLGVMVIVYPLWSLFLLKKRQLRQKKVQSRLYSNLTDAVFGLTDWMISGREKDFVREFERDYREIVGIDRQIRHWNQSRELGLRILSGIILIMMAIWSGIMAQAGLIAPTYIAAFTLVTLPIIEGLIPVSHAIERIPAYQESLRRIGRIEEKGQEEVAYDVTSGIEKEVHIVVDDVSYRYGDNLEEALQQVSLSIPQGHKLALLGKSGAGKSTFLQLLLGAIMPTSGEAKLNGQDCYYYGDGIFELISVLNQKPYLFATTVENNIRLGNQKVTTEEIKHVMKQVKLEQYIHSLPLGLSTQMEETGARFSGGERQRIALARILLKDTPVVILDEPTVGLDPQTEADLIETIFEVLKDKTVIWITHHLMGMEKMDKILFMEKGRIVLEGSHQELMETSERYQRLYRLDRGID